MWYSASKILRLRKPYIHILLELRQWNVGFQYFRGSLSIFLMCLTIYVCWNNLEMDETEQKEYDGEVIPLEFKQGEPFKLTDECLEMLVDKGIVTIEEE